jgi:peptidoglycan-associated lipoprotein
MRAWVVVMVAGLMAGCATTQMASPPVDVAGRWTGTWLGYGVALIGREEDVQLELVQAGASGTGWLMLDGTTASESMPDSIRDAAMTGVRVLFDVSGNRVRVYHELGGDLFEAELVVLGDRMVGQALWTDPVVRFDLARELPRVAGAPVTIAPPPIPSPPAGPPRIAGPMLPPPPPPREAALAPPAPPAPPRSAPLPVEFGAVGQARTVHFDFDRADIRADAAAVLDANAAWLRAHPERIVLIEGHCDERGTAEYNLALGERRALAARTYLLGRGIAESRMAITSYGAERLVCTERTEACWARNRRADFLVK